MTDYTLDTNILILLGRHYPRELFPSIWERLETGVTVGRICICYAVLDELDRGDDTLHDWAKHLTGFVCDPGARDVQVATAISRKYPEWVREEKNAADPWVVAHGNAHARVVVSEEKVAGPGVIAKNQKIPNVATEFGVEALRFFDWLKAEGWTF